MALRQGKLGDEQKRPDHLEYQSENPTFYILTIIGQSSKTICSSYGELCAEIVSSISKIKNEFSTNRSRADRFI